MTSRARFNIDSIKNNMEPLTDASKKFGQDGGQNHDIKIADRSFGNVAQLRYSGRQ
jgi:hypothetical protein